MSFEDSLKALADSNLRLAAAMDKYADTITKFGLKVEEANTGSAEEATDEETARLQYEDRKKNAMLSAGSAGEEKKPRGRPKKVEPAPEPEVEDEDDGFGDDDDEVEEDKPLTAETIKNELKAVRDAAGKDKALAIIQKLGYKAIPEIKEKDYKAVHDACQKILK